MSKKRDITFSIHPFGEDTDLLSIQNWQREGVASIWKAMYELSIYSYAIRGEYIQDKPMQKECFEIKTAPWAGGKIDLSLDA